MITKEMIEKASLKAQKANREHEELRQKWAEQECPFVVGQILINSLGDKGVVTEIKPFSTLGYYLKGNLMKKDGTPSKVVSHLWNHLGWKRWKNDS